MALTNKVPAVNFRNLAPFSQDGVISAEAHGPALVALGVAPRGRAAIHPLGHQSAHGLSGGPDLGRACAIDARHMPRHLDHGHLHSKTNAEIGHLTDPRVAGGLDLALGAALAETARHDDAVDVF